MNRMKDAMMNHKKMFEKSIKSVNEPESYYFGVRATVEQTVNNVVMFRRHKGVPLVKNDIQAHGRFMLIICLKGRGVINISQQNEIELNDGEATLIPPHIPHYHDEMTKDHEWLFITFQAPSGAFAALQTRSFKVPETVYGDLELITSLPQASQSDYQKKCTIMRLQLILLALLNEVDPEDNQGFEDSSFVAEVVHYINQHISQSIDVDELAERFGVSSGYLRLKFKMYSKWSLGKFITTRKFEHAQTLLSDRRMSVKEVSDACGFKSFSTFCRRFKEITGSTPKDYRARFKKG